MVVLNVRFVFGVGLLCVVSFLFSMMFLFRFKCWRFLWCLVVCESLVRL